MYLLNETQALRYAKQGEAALLREITIRSVIIIPSVGYDVDL